MIKQIHASTRFFLDYDPESKEFREWLETYRNLFDPNGSEDDMLMYISHNITKYGLSKPIPKLGRVGYRLDDEGKFAVYVVSNWMDTIDYIFDYHTQIIGTGGYVESVSQDRKDIKIEFWTKEQVSINDLFYIVFDGIKYVLWVDKLQVDEDYYTVFLTSYKPPMLSKANLDLQKLIGEKVIKITDEEEINNCRQARLRYRAI